MIKLDNPSLKPSAAVIASNRCFRYIHVGAFLHYFRLAEVEDPLGLCCMCDSPLQQQGQSYTSGPQIAVRGVGGHRHFFNQ